MTVGRSDALRQCVTVCQSDALGQCVTVCQPDALGQSVAANVHACLVAEETKVQVDLSANMW